MKVQQYLKAIAAAVVSGLGAWSAALAVGPVNTHGYVTIAIVTVTALAAVWAAPNATKGP